MVKYDCTALDIFGFFDSIEILSQKIYKEYEDLDYCGKIEEYIDCAIEFFTEFV